MVAGETFRSWIGIRRRNADHVALMEYLQQLGEESWESEFKTALSQGGDLQPKIAVAALANRYGGELFLGVDPARKLVGTTYDADTLSNVLHQSNAPRFDRFITDLTECVRMGIQTVENIPQGRVLVLEVAAQALPVLVEGPSRELELYVRRSGSSPLLRTFAALEWARERRRESMLRSLYLEFDLMSRQLWTDMGFASGISPVLPFFQECLVDGTFYTVLTSADREAMLGRAGDGGGGNPGFLGRILRLSAEVEQARAMRLSSDPTLKNFLMLNYSVAHNPPLMNIHHEFEMDRKRFRGWIEAQGIRLGAA
jgi:hypothetical protein